jgi:hypothetical protein
MTDYEGEIDKLLDAFQEQVGRLAVATIKYNLEEPKVDVTLVEHILEAKTKLLALLNRARVKDFEDMLELYLNGDGRTPIKKYIEDRIAELTAQPPEKEERNDE